VTPDSERRRDRMLALMADYVDLNDDLAAATTFSEIENIVHAMDDAKAQVDAMIAEQARLNALC
jgi:hypothetical protein